jgi:cellobiose-specific phosphotransferase system component IIC
MKNGQMVEMTRGQLVLWPPTPAHLNGFWLESGEKGLIGKQGIVRFVKAILWFSGLDFLKLVKGFVKSLWYRVGQNKIENFLSKNHRPPFPDEFFISSFLLIFSDTSVAVTIFILTN